jgi:hypothetical protein
MAKAKKPKPIPVKKYSELKLQSGVRRGLIHAAAASLLVAALATGFWFMRNWVEKRVVFPDRPPQIVLKNRPPWMTEFLARQITAAVRPVGTHSAFDHQLLVDVTSMLKSNPWIRRVNQVRRAYDKRPADTIEIDCEYRAPIALVHWHNYYWLVDGEGVKLPEQYTARQVPLVMRGQNRRMEIRVIEGVQLPPVESGMKWAGEDLAAGLDLVKLLHGQDFADEIMRVDVSNFAGRRSVKEAQLTLLTRYDTEVRWGRPINSKDFFVEVSPAQKLSYLKQVYEQFHRVDGNQPWIDIRFDRITYPSGAAPSARADGEP